MEHVSQHSRSGEATFLRHERRCCEDDAASDRTGLSDPFSLISSGGSQRCWWKTLYQNLRYYQSDPSSLPRRKAYRNRVLLFLGICLVLGAIAVLVWFALVAALLRRLAPRRTTNGLHQIVTNWRKPSDSISLLSPWPADFSQDVVPVPCHSHNDYMRSIPLFDALAAGCESVEADLWLRNDTDRDLDLLVGHTSSSLTAQRTLRSLYLDPLIAILQNQSALLKTRRDGPQGLASGVFQMFPNTTLILLLDFKSNGTELWPVVSQQLEPLRQGGWLTSWNSSSNSTTWGPIRVVGSGNTPFDAIVANTTYRDIFFDVPLEDVANPQYDTSNSYLASISIQSAVGKMWNGKFSSKQLETIRYQISQARGKGLVPRYWDTVSWPVSWRNYVWSTLVDNDTGLLNVDDLQEASRWDWSWCIVAGLVLCGY